MSVPKRFKTKAQVFSRKKFNEVLTKGSSFHLLSRDILFTHTTRHRSINNQKLNYFKLK